MEFTPIELVMDEVQSLAADTLYCLRDSSKSQEEKDDQIANLVRCLNEQIDALHNHISEHDRAPSTEFGNDILTLVRSYAESLGKELPNLNQNDITRTLVAQFKKVTENALFPRIGKGKVLPAQNSWLSNIIWLKLRIESDRLTREDGKEPDDCHQLSKLTEMYPGGNLLSEQYVAAAANLIRTTHTSLCLPEAPKEGEDRRMAQLRLVIEKKTVTAEACRCIDASISTIGLIQTKLGQNNKHSKSLEDARRRLLSEGERLLSP